MNWHDISAGIGLASFVINFIWSSVNLRLMRNMEERFVTRAEWEGRKELCDERHDSVANRLTRLEARRHS